MLSQQFRLVTAAALVLLSMQLRAQNSPPASTPVTLPLAGVHYRYWPEQMVQWIGPELPYSMIVLDIDDRGKQPIYDVDLIDKSGKSAGHYTNTAEEFAIDQRAGLTVHQVAMQFDGPSDPVKGAQYMLRFNTETGVPVVWQFVLGTDVFEQGSGPSSVPAPIPILMYRGQAGLADQGTALQVGGITSTANVWKEIAQPPHFVPYRGAFSVGVQILSFIPGTSSWKSDGQTLTDSAGTTLSIARDGNTVTMTDKALGTIASYILEGDTTVSRVSFGSVHGRREDTVTLQFSPALALTGQRSFDVIAGKKNKISAGIVETGVAEETSKSFTWNFTAPEALHGKTATAKVSVLP